MVFDFSKESTNYQHPIGSLLRDSPRLNANEVPKVTCAISSEKVFRFAEHFRLRWVTAVHAVCYELQSERSKIFMLCSRINRSAESNKQMELSLQASLYSFGRYL